MPPDRLPADTFRPSIIRAMTLKCMAKAGTNLAQGFPEEDPPEEILRLLTSDRLAGSHQYSDPRGAQILRRAIAGRLQRSNDIQADPEENVLVTCGATEAMMVTLRGLFEPGDELITFAPAYENYFLQALAARIQLNILSVQEPDFGFSLSDLERAYNPRVRGVLICNPCNPSGKVFSRAELGNIAEYAARHNLFIIADETYEQFVWRGAHISIASLAEAAERTITIVSLGKTYSITGWRIGYLVAPSSISRRLAAIHDFTTVCAPHPLQQIVAQALQLPASFYAAFRAQYAQRKNVLARALAEAGFHVSDPAGSYFLWCDYSELSGDPDTVFADHLLDSCGIAAVPGSVFYPTGMQAPKRIRFTFSKSDSTIANAVGRLQTFRRQHAVGMLQS